VIILHCIAALHSQLGAKTERLTEQEIKEACTHFQCAAGVLVYLYVRCCALFKAIYNVINRTILEPITVKTWLQS